MSGCDDGDGECYEDEEGKERRREEEEDDSSQLRRGRSNVYTRIELGEDR